METNEDNKYARDIVSWIIKTISLGPDHNEQYGCRKHPDGTIIIQWLDGKADVCVKGIFTRKMKEIRKEAIHVGLPPGTRLGFLDSRSVSSKQF